jgi:choline dehydrogenase-like flavoprotein
MILDTDGPDRAAFGAASGRVFDLCVIGAGPAGITLARRLAARGFSVALMEAGGREWSPESQALYQGEVVGVPTPELDAARLRHLGGTSGHWNGRARHLDAADFRAPPDGPDRPLGGWPITRADLDPYVAETEAILALTPPAPLPDADADQAAPGLHRIWFQRSGTPEDGPLRFGEAFAEELAAAEAILVGLHANLVDLRLEADFAGSDAPAVAEARFRGYGEGDAGFAVRARHYALCCGGIENARLLLNFTSQLPAGLGNQNDLVGRCFMDHPTIVFGEVALARPQDWDATLHYAPSEAFMAAEGSRNFNCAVRWGPRPPLPFLREAARSAQCDLPFAERLAEAVLGERALNCDFPGGLRQWWLRRDPYREAMARAEVEIEQAPDPASRVALAETRDALGLLRPRLDWRLGEADHRTLEAAVVAFGEHVAEIGLGRLRLADWLADGTVRFPSEEENGRPLTSWHHLGTTRMADDPRRGVTDAHARVHGIANLHIGGSSLFATGGYANPTYTIVQLALRLGDRLAAEFGG